MVCETDVQGNITYANKLALKQLNIAEAAIPGSSLFSYIAPEQRERVRKNFADVTRGQKQKLEECTARAGNGTTFPVLIRSAPIYEGNDVTGVRSVIIDISERHSLEEQLRRAQRMEVIGLMAGGVAHDLNNILSGVINYPELILQNLPDNSKLSDQVKAIKKSGLRAAEVVADLLTVARGVAAARVVAHPNALITEYLESPEFHQLQSLYPGISWQTELDPAVANIACSPTHVTKSIMNLITNAAEAVPATSGQVTISTTSLQPGEFKAQSAMNNTGSWTAISIRDNGPGIALKDQEHIFEPFYTKKVMGKSGTGLGLTVVWNTMLDHAGEVRVNSEIKGQGYEDVVTKILQENLPEYSHQTLTANLSRHFYNFKQGKKVCNVGLYRTPEREKFLYFSIPSFFTLPTVLVIRKDRYEDFGGNKTIQLDALLRNGKITIGRAEKRSYGKYVDAILDRYKDQDNIFVFEEEELSQNFIRMLELGRLDAMISLPEEAIYQAEQLGIRDKIMTLTIEENQVGYDSWLSSVGCSKTEWGKNIIEKIDNILLRQRPSKRYREAYERWLDKSSLKNYRKLYKEVFLQTTTSAGQ
jgi:uncharacterized protein (TIGR02285 family)